MALLDNVSKIKQEAIDRISNADSVDSLNEVRVKYLGRKGELTAILKGLKDLSPDEKKAVGAEANKTRQFLEEQISIAQVKLSTEKTDSAFDPTLPGTAPRQGAVHIINQVIDQICHTFHGMGFEIARGPDIETDFYNFEALNFPDDHPARDMQDTMFVEGDRLLRTHTTPVQIRELMKGNPPVKIIAPGRTYRHEAISTRAHIAFHQVDGFLVDEHVTMADMKGALVAFCKAFFGEELKLKFRPSFFPFTEPSAEVDISCFLCKGKGCQLCKYSGWLEILGCGMIDPNVLIKTGHDPEKYTGYAFGMGVERIAMLKYKITDIRLFFNNDIRFLRQFE
ncbi:MAG: phenylalanine--tRNA ligase subunit alpha [Candidatus Zixiibacteriota bacterium]|nr:MAG: phenylalanine--tRNA ligase subunit alpha [candidate division Zixibacteria bacterium]